MKNNELTSVGRNNRFWTRCEISAGMVSDGWGIKGFEPEYKLNVIGKLMIWNYRCVLIDLMKEVT